jgi:hypothetical protein
MACGSPGIDRGRQNRRVVGRVGDPTVRKYNGPIERYLERRSGFHIELVATGTQGSEKQRFRRPNPTMAPMPGAFEVDVVIVCP